MTVWLWVVLVVGVVVLHLARVLVLVRRPAVLVVLLRRVFV